MKRTQEEMDQDLHSLVETVRSFRQPRYVVVDGSQSAHCCFDATVVDTHKKDTHLETYEIVCECFSKEDAQNIADALNKAESPR